MHTDGVSLCIKDVCFCLQPFVDEVHPLQSLFLPRLYALLIPVVAGVIALIGLGMFVIRLYCS